MASSAPHWARVYTGGIPGRRSPGPARPAARAACRRGSSPGSTRATCTSVGDDAPGALDDDLDAVGLAGPVGGRAAAGLVVLGLRRTRSARRRRPPAVVHSPQSPRSSLTRNCTTTSVRSPSAPGDADGGELVRVGLGDGECRDPGELVPGRGQPVGGVLGFVLAAFRFGRRLGLRRCRGRGCRGLGGNRAGRLAIGRHDGVAFGLDDRAQDHLIDGGLDRARLGRGSGVDGQDHECPGHRDESGKSREGAVHEWSSDEACEHPSVRVHDRCSRSWGPGTRLLLCGRERKGTSQTHNSQVRRARQRGGEGHFLFIHGRAEPSLESCRRTPSRHAPGRTGGTARRAARDPPAGPVVRHQPVPAAAVASAADVNGRAVGTETGPAGPVSRSPPRRPPCLTSLSFVLRAVVGIGHHSGPVLPGSADHPPSRSSEEAGEPTTRSAGGDAGRSPAPPSAGPARWPPAPPGDSARPPPPPAPAAVRPRVTRPGPRTRTERDAAFDAPPARGFGSVLGLTTLGALLPGTGFIAAGYRKIGWTLLAGLVALIGLGAWLATGGQHMADPARRQPDRPAPDHRRRRRPRRRLVARRHRRSTACSPPMPPRPAST